MADRFWDRCYNDRVFKRLGRVQAWKSLFNKLEFGIADRPLNFNQVRRVKYTIYILILQLHDMVMDGQDTVLISSNWSLSLVLEC